MVIAYRRVGWSSGRRRRNQGRRPPHRDQRCRFAGLLVDGFGGSHAFRTRWPSTSPADIAQGRGGLDRHRPDLVVLDHAQIAWALPADLRPAGRLPGSQRRAAALREAAERSRWPMSWVNRREARGDRAGRGAPGSARRPGLGPVRQRCQLARRSEPSAIDRRSSTSRPRLEIERRSEEPRFDIATIGSWTWDANAAGLRWFIDRVVPLLPRQVQVGVAGAGAGADRGRPRTTSTY